MYFWRIERLKGELQGRDVPAREVMKYATAHLLLWTVAASIPAFVPTEDPAPADSLWVSLVGSAVILVFGVWSAYRANGGDGGRDLAGRLLALSWVLGLRLMLFGVALFMALMIAVVAAAMAQKETSETAEMSGSTVEWVATVTVLLWSVLFFWRLARHLRDVRVRPSDA